MWYRVYVPGTAVHAPVRYIFGTGTKYLPRPAVSVPGQVPVIEHGAKLMRFVLGRVPYLHRVEDPLLFNIHTIPVRSEDIVYRCT